MAYLNESVLERVLNESEGIPNPTPFRKEQERFSEGTWFSIAWKAMESIKAPYEIVEFMGEYIAHIQKQEGCTVEEATGFANRAVGYCTGYAENDIANIWFEALPDISHPVMGRERPFLKGRDIGSFYFICRSSDPEIRDYVKEVLMETNRAFFGKIEYVEGSDWYFAFMFDVANRERWGKMGGDKAIYLFFTGLAEGMRGKMESDLGKSCEITLDTLKSS